jgi:hypothetical protein
LLEKDLPELAIGGDFLETGSNPAQKPASRTQSKAGNAV